MSLRGKKLGLMISVGPDHPNFRRGVTLADIALAEGVVVYLYCIDEAVRGVADSRIQALRERGLNLFACAYGAQRRNLSLDERATYAGLAVVNDLIAATDRFISFN